MLFTLCEALRQIDPHVVLDDGITSRTVEQLLFSTNTASPLEYVISVDYLGRLVIFEIDSHGFAVFPAAFVEKKRSDLIDTPVKNARAPVAANFHLRLA